MSPMDERARFVRILLMLLLSTSIVPVTSNPNGLSIDCGSDKVYTDEKGIIWVPDASFVATGKNAQIPPGQSFNDQQTATLRFFDEGRGRDCYVLPVVPGSTYLVRPTAYYGAWNSTANVTAFDVYLNANIISRVRFDQDNGDDGIFLVEALVYLTTKTLDVCLVRHEGTPFLSALELRKLDAGMYLPAVGSNKFIGTLTRYNTGTDLNGPPYLRYPDDQYDRIWLTPGSWDNATHVKNQTVIAPSSTLPEKPPQKVMEDAWFYPESDTLWYTAFTDHYPVLGPISVYSYFQELNESANGSRGMEYYVGDELIASFNASNEPYEARSCIVDVTDAKINLTVTKAHGSILRPILNAFEVYLVSDWNLSATAPEDVKSIAALQRQFNLTDWFGDPCIPVPYDWLNCSLSDQTSANSNNTSATSNVFLRSDPVINSTAHIITISLAHIATLPTFPDEVLQFSKLAFLNLSNTSLPSIPSTSFSGMQNLTILDVSNNKMSGEVLNFVQNITAASTIQRLYAANNLLEGEFPLDQLLDQFPNLVEAHFDGMKISGILNLTSLQTALTSLGYGNSTGNSVVRAAVTPLAGSPSKFPLISLTKNQITGITPSLDVLSSDINNFLQTLQKTTYSLANVNGILLGGNPWCEQTKFSAQPLPQQYLCRSTSSDNLPAIGGLYSSKSTNVGAIVGGVLGGIAFLFFCVCVVALWRLHRRTSSLQEIQEALARQKVQPPFYSYAALRAATHDFGPENKLGQGSFGAVYKGAVLDTTDGTQELVAVKKLYHSKQALSEFLNEAVLITGIKHRNLVQLRGCCIHKEDQRMLVYEYAENGNLAEALWDAPGDEKPGEQDVSTVLDWQQRLNICVGIARGLSYLHEELQPRIIHRDIKPGNILLDGNYNAKIADFGLARSILEGQEEADFTQIAGTKGYFSPEYATQGQLTEKADVFSFGVVLLEIVSGRKWKDDRLPPEKQFLQPWARHLRAEGKLLDLLDPKARKTANDDEVIRVVCLAILCLEFEPAKRPTMSEAVTMLQGITSVTLYKPDPDTTTHSSPTGGAYNYMRLPNLLDDPSEDLPVDSFGMSATSSTNDDHDVELSRLSAR